MKGIHNSFYLCNKVFPSKTGCLHKQKVADFILSIGELYLCYSEETEVFKWQKKKLKISAEHGRNAVVSLMMAYMKDNSFLLSIIANDHFCTLITLYAISLAVN